MSSPKFAGLSPRACEVCNAKKDLLRCSSCQVTYYCSADHQASDRPRHKEACVTVKKARAKCQKEEQKLRDMPPDFSVPENVFENGAGHFWGIIETRPYMRARHGVVDALMLTMGATGARVDAIQTCLDILNDMMRLCRSDNMGLRGIIPSLYIRLGQDQTCYDFMKWYATTGQDPEYDWGEIDLPFLDLKGEDVLEPMGDIWRIMGWLDFSHGVALMLIKVRVLLDLQNLQAAAIALGGKFPQELVSIIQDQLVGPIIASRPELLRQSPDMIGEQIEAMKSQVQALYKSVDTYNKHFWPSMLGNPVAAIKDRPNSISAHSQGESNLIIGYSYYAWDETPGALNMMAMLRNKMGSE